MNSSDASAVTGVDAAAIAQLVKMREAELQNNVIDPLLKALGFDNITDVSGPHEKGRVAHATTVNHTSGWRVAHTTILNVTSGCPCKSSVGLRGEVSRFRHNAQ